MARGFIFAKPVKPAGVSFGKVSEPDGLSDFLYLASVGWRYDSCSGKIIFRWNLPPSIPHDEATSLSLIYNVIGTNSYYRAAFLDLNKTIDGISPGSEVSFDVILAPRSFETYWPFNDMPVFAISRLKPDASGKVANLYVYFNKWIHIMAQDTQNDQRPDLKEH